MNILLKFASWAFFLYLIYCGFLYLMQRQIMFPCNMIDVPHRNTDIPGVEKIGLSTSSGKTEAWFLPPEQSGDNEPCPAVIFAHGNGELIDFWPEALRPFTRLGAGVLLVEYPGYGRSEGTPTQQSITETFIAAYDRLTARKNVDPSRIILVGRSIGGGAICQLTAKRSSAAIILMSSFTSARSFASKYFVPGFCVRDPFDNQAVIRNYPGPVLVIHGKKDEMIPYSHGIALSQAAKHGKLITYNSGHNDCPPDWNLFWKEIQSFLYEAKILTITNP